MELGEKLTNLKLDQTFLKELNEEDVEFAEKQFKKLYACTLLHNFRGNEQNIIQDGKNITR